MSLDSQWIVRFVICITSTETDLLEGFAWLMAAVKIAVLLRRE